MSNLHKLFQEPNISSIYMTFLKTLWAHPRECRIFVGVVLGTDNRYGLKLIVTQS